ncbi:hypothetical protein [Amycolatopsis sp. cmx-11-51]|uniref:hypothetical protein n=1 Tax=unclassified Amycolatopsis TaxID=2618356 RepID=UPI0039E3ABD6
MIVRVRGRALPDGGYVDLHADGDRWTADPVLGAEPVAEGWLVPGPSSMRKIRVRTWRGWSTPSRSSCGASASGEPTRFVL